MTLKLRYAVSNGRTVQLGDGVTSNLSSRGVLFTNPETVTPGSRVLLTVAWPIEREGSPMDLRLWGIILRSDSQGIAAAIVGHAIVPGKQVESMETQGCTHPHAA